MPRRFGEMPDAIAAIKEFRNHYTGKAYRPQGGPTGNAVGHTGSASSRWRGQGRSVSQP